MDLSGTNPCSLHAPAVRRGIGAAARTQIHEERSGGGEGLGKRMVVNDTNDTFAAIRVVLKGLRHLFSLGVVYQHH